MTPTDRDLVFEDFNPPRRPLRIAIVTETYPPEVNGVALSLARLVDGLNARGHAVQLVRPRQSAGGAQLAVGLEEVLTRGLPIPNYPSLRMGVPSKRALMRYGASSGCKRSDRQSLRQQESGAWRHPRSTPHR